MKGNWFFYFLSKAITERAGRFGLSAFGVLLLGAVLTAYLLIAGGIRQSLGKELRRFGANMIVLPGQRSISESALRKIQSYPGVRTVEPQIYGTVLIEGHPVNLIGLPVKDFLAGRLTGKLPGADMETLAGISLAKVLSLEPDSEVQTSSGMVLKIVGVFERGTDEDMALVVSINTARKLLSFSGYSAILVNAAPESLNSLVKRISSELGLKTKTVVQIARAEQSLYEKIKLLMMMVMVVVTVSVSASLSSTMGANVLERREEIGLMKALGAKRITIDLYFLAEATFAGIIGSGVGFIAGIGIAEAVSKTAFGTFVPVKLFVLVPVVLVCTVVVFGSTVITVRKATGVPASWILRGE